MALSELPAERHRQIAALFTDRVRGARSWDAPSPVAEWTARDVVRHLIEWFSGFLSSGAGIELPRGPSVDADPVAGRIRLSASNQRMKRPGQPPGLSVELVRVDFGFDSAADRTHAAANLLTR